MTESNDLVIWLQRWLSLNCDGDWEHNENIKIFNIDNPGWGVRINLIDTYLENRIFKEIEINNSEKDWYYCFIRDGKFQGSGGVNNLYDILKIFKEWSQSSK